MESNEKLIRRNVKILDIKKNKNNVIFLKIEKPKDFNFIPGQSIEMTFNNKEWENKKRPFSFVSLPSDSELDFAIRVYEEHNGFTKKLKGMNVGDEIILIGNPYGKYVWRGKGVFIAGGLGITPLYCLAKSLKKLDVKNSKFIYSAKNKEDIIYGSELDEIFGKNLIYRYSRKEGRVDSKFLSDVLNSEDLKGVFYICGPPMFRKQIKKIIEDFGVDSDKIIS